MIKKDIEYVINPHCIKTVSTTYCDGIMYCHYYYFEAWIGEGSERLFRKITEKKFKWLCCKS